MNIYDTCSDAQWIVSIASLIGLVWIFFEVRRIGDREGFKRGYELGAKDRCP